MLLRIGAIWVALLHSLRHGAALGIRPRELPRYLEKSANFALCYSGFTIGGGWWEARRVGLAAFLCCAYDVVTDWRSFEPRARAVFETLLSRSVEGELAALASSLYDKEVLGTLADDGLERGEIALEFVTRILGTREHFERRVGVGRLGMLLQIVDDVLDVEGDAQRGEMNCLLTVRRERYLRFLQNELPEERARALFPGDRVLPLVVCKAQRKAQRFLAEKSLRSAVARGVGAMSSESASTRPCGENVPRRAESTCASRESTTSTAG